MNTLIKKIALVCTFAVTGSLAANAQDYKAPLEKTWVTFDTTKAPATKVELANKLTLIAKKWSNEWITHYYAATAKAIVSYDEKDPTKHDAILDDAEKELQDAVSILGKENDETLVVAAMIANSRIMTNPMERWQKYGGIFSEKLNGAKDINPENPRIYYLKGTTIFFTPKNYGGGKENALPLFEKAATYFAKETGTDISKPSWGKNYNTYFLEQCKTEDKK